MREVASRWVPVRTAAPAPADPADPQRGEAGPAHVEDAAAQDAASAPEPASAQEAAGPERLTEGENDEQKAESKESKRWELIIAVSIAVTAVTGAVLTYLALQKESAAMESDRESVVQTVMVQNQNVAAKIQVDASDVLAGRYRQLMAEASVLSRSDADQAVLTRLNAAGFIANSSVSDYLRGTGATARYDDSGALQGALAVDATSASLPPDEPALTARIAAHDYVISRRIRMSIVGLLAIVVLLTIARLSKARKWRRGLFAAAALGYAVATAAAIIQAV